MISDIVLSIFAFYLFNVHRSTNPKWSMFFLFMGVSAFIGGIYHGYNIIGEPFRFLSWACLTVALLFAQNATYKHINNKLVKILYTSKSIILLFLSINTGDFSFIVIDTAISMLGFIVIGNTFFLRSSSKYINYGILISISSAFFVVSKTSLHAEYFTCNDIGHYITILSLLVISKGVREDYINDIVAARRN